MSFRWRTICLDQSILKIILTLISISPSSLSIGQKEALKKILWCDDDAIKPYFVMAGKNLRYRNLRRQLKDSFVNKPFPFLPEEIQKVTYFELGNIEDHFKYREAVKKPIQMEIILSLKAIITCNTRSRIRKDLLICLFPSSKRTDCQRPTIHHHLQNRHVRQFLFSVLIRTYCLTHHRPRSVREQSLCHPIAP